MLSAIAMGKVRAAKILEIWHHQSQHTTRLENAHAFRKECWDFSMRNVLKKVGGVHQLGNPIIQRQPPEKVGLLN
jgi:hypothetical protein